MAAATYPVAALGLVQAGLELAQSELESLAQARMEREQQPQLGGADRGSQVPPVLVGDGNRHSQRDLLQWSACEGDQILQSWSDIPTGASTTEAAAGAVVA
jgi:hypothetical protein